MNKIIIIAIIIVIVVIGGSLLLSKGYQKPNPGTNPPPSGGNTESKITIKNFAFNPATLSVKAGTVVTWTNEDAAPHRIKSTTFNSENLNTGDSFQFTFSEKGTFDYSCSIHPSMTGKIIVE